MKDGETTVERDENESETDTSKKMTVTGKTMDEDTVVTVIGAVVVNVVVVVIGTVVVAVCVAVGFADKVAASRL